MLKLGDDAHLHPKKKKPKKGRRGGVQAPFLPRLGHGAPKAIKEMKKEGASSFFTESWRWFFRSNRKKKKKEQVLFLPRVGNGVIKTTKKNDKGGAKFPLH